MKRIFIVLIIALLAMIGCAKKVDIEAEKAKVKSVLDQWIQAFETEDMELLSKTMAYDDDIVTFGTDAGEHWIGWEQLKEAFENIFAACEDIDWSVRDQNIKVNASGNVAWFSWIDDVNFIVQGEPGSRESARMTGVLEKRNGNWVIVQLHHSVPLAEEPTEN